MSLPPPKSLRSRTADKLRQSASTVPAKRGAPAVDDAETSRGENTSHPPEDAADPKRIRLSSPSAAVSDGVDPHSSPTAVNLHLSPTAVKPHSSPTTVKPYSSPAAVTEPTIGTPSTWSPSPPPAADPLSGFTGVDHVDADTLKRVLDFVAMSDSVNGRYNIDNIPATAKWGDRYDTEKYLCDKGNRKLTCWVVGVVKSSWFATTAGDPVPRVNISVRPVRAADLAALHQLHNRSNPRPDKYPERASASRFQTRKVKGSALPQSFLFDRIYDATRKFKSKSVMVKLPHTRVGRGDVLLLETFVNRYRTAGDNKGWKDWRVALELNELSVVFEAPDGFVDDEDEPTSLEVDDDI